MKIKNLILSIIMAVSAVTAQGHIVKQDLLMKTINLNELKQLIKEYASSNIIAPLFVFGESHWDGRSDLSEEDFNKYFHNQLMDYINSKD